MITRFTGAEINISGPEDLVNALDYQLSLSTKDDDDSDNETRKITILVGTKSAPKEDLMMPASLVKIAHESGGYSLYFCQFIPWIVVLLVIICNSYNS